MRNPRLDDPKQIAYLMRELNRMNQSSFKSPFTGMLTLMCYTLWKDYKYSVNKLADFCKKFNEYYNVNDEKDNVEELNERLFEFAGWKVEFIKYTEKDFPVTKSKIYRDAIKKQVEYNNRINALCTRYMTYGFLVLIDDGWKSKKLSNYKDRINIRLDNVSNRQPDPENNGQLTPGIMEYWQELVDNTGLYIEKPKFE